MRPDRDRPTRIRTRLAYLALAAAAALSAFCSFGDSGSENVDGLTLEDFRQRMLTAMFTPNGVMHTHESFEAIGGNRVVTAEQDIWRSAVTREARVEAGMAAPMIFANGARHSLDLAGAVQSLPYGELEDNRSLLGSASVLFSSTADSSRIERDTVEGVEAIRIDISLPTGDGSGKAKVYLAEASWLPIRVEYPAVISYYQHELVERDTLPADFFSPESLEGEAAPD